MGIGSKYLLWDKALVLGNGRAEPKCVAVRNAMVEGHFRFLARRISENDDKASLLNSCTFIYLLFRFVRGENHFYYYLHESEHIINRLINFGYSFKSENVELWTFLKVLCLFRAKRLLCKMSVGRSQRILLWQHTHRRAWLSLLWPWTPDINVSEYISCD